MPTPGEVACLPLRMAGILDEAGYAACVAEFDRDLAGGLEDPWALRGLGQGADVPVACIRPVPVTRLIVPTWARPAPPAPACCPCTCGSCCPR